MPSKREIRERKRKQELREVAAKKHAAKIATKKAQELAEQGMCRFWAQMASALLTPSAVLQVRVRRCPQ